MYLDFAYVRARQRSLYSGLCALLGGVCGQQLAISAVTSFILGGVCGQQLAVSSYSVEFVASSLLYLQILASYSVEFVASSLLYLQILASYSVEFVASSSLYLQIPASQYVLSPTVISYRLIQLSLPQAVLDQNIGGFSPSPSFISTPFPSSSFSPLPLSLPLEVGLFHTANESGGAL